MNAKQLALGGMTAALAVVILCLGGLVPFATYILPMLCCILLQLLLPSLGNRGGWVWYCSVSFLAALLCPDKEAAATMVFLGYYPLIKPHFPSNLWGFMGKLLLFNAATLTMYAILIHLLGMAAIGAEFRELGTFFTALTLVLGNVCFFLLDRVLTIFPKKRPGA